jgi:hypothetical protein
MHCRKARLAFIDGKNWLQPMACQQLTIDLNCRAASAPPPDSASPTTLPSGPQGRVVSASLTPRPSRRARCTTASWLQPRFPQCSRSPARLAWRARLGATLRCVESENVGHGRVRGKAPGPSATAHSQCRARREIGVAQGRYAESRSIVNRSPMLSRRPRRRSRAG